MAQRQTQPRTRTIHVRFSAKNAQHQAILAALKQSGRRACRESPDKQMLYLLAVMFGQAQASASQTGIENFPACLLAGNDGGLCRTASKPTPRPVLTLVPPGKASEEAEKGR